MDLYQQAQALVDDNRLTAVISAVVTMLSLLPKLLSPLFKTLQTHSWQPVRKTFEQLKSLRSSTSNNPELNQYLEKAIELEAFRLASGISTSEAKMKFLLRLAQDGTWTKQQLRLLCKHIEIPEGSTEPRLAISTFDKMTAAWSAIAAMVICAAGSTVFVVSAYQFSLKGLITGAGSLAISLTLGRFVVDDYLSYRIARRTQTLMQHR
nr:hypothetical protein [Gammaproteobacteria bacterium]